MEDKIAAGNLRLGVLRIMGGTAMKMLKNVKESPIHASTTLTPVQ